MVERVYDDLDRVSERADQILDLTVRYFQNNGVEVPEKTYLAMGGEDMVAHDNCSQLTVSLVNSRHGLPNPDTPSTLRVNTCKKAFIVDFVIQVVRCTPSMSSDSGATSVRQQALQPSVSVSALDESARRQMRDVFTLHRIAEEINDLPDQLGTALNYNIVVGPDSGGLQAVSLIIPVNV